MTPNADEMELQDRLNLIETMIAEGRRTTESWAWAFVLWGLAYYVAIAWATWGRTTLAWPVTMTAAFVLTAVLASRKGHRHPATTIGRAISSVWIAMGISMFVLFFSMSVSGRYEQHAFVAIVGAMLGTANAASSMILRWKMQFACALVWWAATVVACFGSEQQISIAFLATIFFCQIVFGVYAMICNGRQRTQGATNA